MQWRAPALACAGGSLAEWEIRCVRDVVQYEQHVARNAMVQQPPWQSMRAEHMYTLCDAHHGEVNAKRQVACGYSWQCVSADVPIAEHQMDISLLLV